MTFDGRSQVPAQGLCTCDYLRLREGRERVPDARAPGQKGRGRMKGAESDSQVLMASVLMRTPRPKSFRIINRTKRYRFEARER